MGGEGICRADLPQKAFSLQVTGAGVIPSRTAPSPGSLPRHTAARVHVSPLCCRENSASLSSHRAHPPGPEPHHLPQALPPLALWRPPPVISALRFLSLLSMWSELMISEAEMLWMRGQACCSVSARRVQTEGHCPHGRGGSLRPHLLGPPGLWLLEHQSPSYLPRKVSRRARNSTVRPSESALWLWELNGQESLDLFSGSLCPPPWPLQQPVGFCSVRLLSSTARLQSTSQNPPRRQRQPVAAVQQAVCVCCVPPPHGHRWKSLSIQDRYGVWRCGCLLTLRINWETMKGGKRVIIGAVVGWRTSLPSFALFDGSA